MEKNNNLRLRAGDKEKLKNIVNELNSAGLDVLLTGSSLFSSDYHDIDLIIRGNLRTGQLPQIVGELIKRYENIKEIFYEFDNIRERYKFDFNGTIFDISYSQNSAGELYSEKETLAL